MPIYRIQDSNGNIHRVEAANPQVAQSELASLAIQSPEMFAKPGVRAAMQEKLASPSGKALMNQSEIGNLATRATSAATLGLSNQESSLIDAAGTAIRNVLPFGKKPGYSAQDAYDAARLLQVKQSQQFQAQHPYLAGAADVAGSLAMPGAEAVGKFILGSAAPALAATGKAIPMGIRAAQVARAAPVVAGLSATQGALSAQPGQEGIDAARAAASSLAAAPALWAGTGAVSKAAPVIANAVTKMANSDIATNAMTKLATALKNAKLSPADLQSAFDNMKANGAVTPTLVDILQKAGAGPKVMRLVQTAGSSPAAIRTAQQYAAHTRADLQNKAAAHINGTLDTSAIPQSVPQLAAANDAAIQASKVADDAHAQALADAKVSQTQSAQTPMTTGVAPEEGGEAVSADLNKAFDTSRKVHEDAFKLVDAAHPESAIVADSQRAPLATDIMSKVAPYTAEDFSSSNTLLKKLDGLKEGAAAPAPTGDETAIPPGYAANQTAVQPLTVRRLRDLDRWTGAQVSKMGSDNPEAIQFIVAQNAIRDNLAKLSDEGHIEGDPNVVSALNTAINAYAEHKKTFGDGLVSDLTERNNRKDDRPVIPSYAASEHIFGSGDNLKPLTNVVPDLENIRRIVSPDAFGKLQAEAAGRYGPQDLLDYAKAHPTAGETIFSPDTRAAAQNTINSAKSEADASVRQARVAAQNAADAAQGATASNAALDTGAGVLKTPPVDFSAAVDAHDDNVLPHAQVAAKQALLNTVQTGKLPDYDPNGVGVANIGKLFNPDAASAYSGGLSNISDQNDNAAGLAKSLLAGAENSKSWGDIVAGRHIDTMHGLGRRVVAEKYNKMIGSKLTPDEGDALIDNLVSDAGVSLPALQDLMVKRKSGAISPEADSVLTPMLTKSAVAAPDANPTAVQDLKTKYGLDLPMDYAPG